MRLISMLLTLVLTTGLAEAGTSNKQLKQRINVLIEALVVCPSNSPTRFVDNGDGTICDHETGLMWEKKDSADGIQNYINPHDADNTYTWTNDGPGGTAQNGTAFTRFLPQLNGVLATNVGTGSEQLAGYRDWRIPTNAELRTLQFETPPCAIIPCIIDPIFEPTIVGGYWTSTSGAATIPPGPPSPVAWFVPFFNGPAFADFKPAAYFVRAVRGGR